MQFFQAKVKELVSSIFCNSTQDPSPRKKRELETFLMHFIFLPYLMLSIIGFDIVLSADQAKTEM